jgi:hypothetical protein
MEHAEEIAQLLVQEINKPRPGPEAQFACDLLQWAVITLQTPQHSA